MVRTVRYGTALTWTFATKINKQSFVV